MSRVIKAALWKEKPHVIETPTPEKKAKEPEGDGFNEEARQHMLAEIAAKEQRASEHLKEAQVQADILKQNAEKEAEDIRREAQAEIDALKEKARQAGHDEGFAEGKQDGLKQAQEDMKNSLDDAAKQATKLLKDAQIASEDYVQRSEEEIVSIAMAVVEKVLPQHFIDAPQVVLPLVRKALEKVKDQSKIIVHVAPVNYDMVLLARDEFRTMLTGADAVLDVHADDMLEPGDCVIETPNGSVDARLATQLEQIKEAVREVMS